MMRRKAIEEAQPYEWLWSVDSHGQQFHVLRVPGSVVPFIGLADDYEPLPEDGLGVLA